MTERAKQRMDAALANASRDDLIRAIRALNDDVAVLERALDIERAKYGDAVTHRNAAYASERNLQAALDAAVREREGAREAQHVWENASKMQDSLMENLHTRITAVEKVVEALRNLTDEAWAALPYVEAQKARGTVNGLNRHIAAARAALSTYAALTDATEQGPRGGSK